MLVDRLVVKRPSVYGDYLKAARAYFTGPILVLCMLAMQGSQIMNSYTLIWWQAKYVRLLTWTVTGNTTHLTGTARGTDRTLSTRFCTHVWVSLSPYSPSACE